MATFPTGIFSPTDPIATDKMNVVSHSAQHRALNAEVIAIETSLGTALSNVVTTAALSTDGTLVASSDALVATQKAVKTYADAMVLSGGGIPLGYLDTDVTLAADSDTKVPSQKAVVAFVNRLYPVGCIYTTTVATNPATVFGFGTWEAFGSGRVLVGLDVGQTEFDAVEETGGATTVTLTTANIPSHTHSNTTNYSSGSAGQERLKTVAGAQEYLWESTPTGGGGSHNNLQPYIVVYFFKRTA
jgi:hypothetical protein